MIFILHQDHNPHPSHPSQDHNEFHVPLACFVTFHASHEVYHVYILIRLINIYSIAHPIALLCCIKGIIAERIQLNTFGNRFSSAANKVFIRYRSFGLHLIHLSIHHPSKQAGQFSSMIGRFIVFANSLSCFSRIYTNGRITRISCSLLI